MTSLPDVNVLLALAWPNHAHHAVAHDWFGGLGGDPWATCPQTQSAFVRVSSNIRAIPQARTPGEAIVLLERIVALPGHRFWPDDVAIVDSHHVARHKLLGHRQVMDAHLLALALSRQARLVTLDRGIEALLPTGADPAALVCLRC